MPEPEVIACPSCKHALRVVAEWLGQTVQCPECQAKFTAPRREGGALTEAVLLQSPPATKAPRTRRTDLFLMLPAFGLMLLGVMASLVDGAIAVRAFVDPAQAEQDFVAILKSWNGGQPIGEETPEQIAARGAPLIRLLVAACAGLGVLSFLGGLALARGKRFWLAQAGCVAASINIANGCCLPGVLFGLWGIVLLNSEEGRAHFGR